MPKIQQRGLPKLKGLCMPQCKHLLCLSLHAVWDSITTLTRVRQVWLLGSRVHESYCTMAMQIHIHLLPVAPIQPLTPRKLPDFHPLAHITHIRLDTDSRGAEDWSLREYEWILRSVCQWEEHIAFETLKLLGVYSHGEVCGMLSIHSIWYEIKIKAGQSAWTTLGVEWIN